MHFALVAVLFLSVNSCAQWQMQVSHTKESLRGVSVVDANIIWASGTRGTYLLTSDGGKNWAAHQVPGAESLDFRGVKAFGSHAFLLAAGPGDKSRIYHTADSGNHWELQFTNPEPKGFLDCMAFSDEKHGIVVGDPVNGKFQILRTEDGGKNWRYADPNGMPAAVDSEGAFAASNSCITVNGRNVWFVTGGSAARVFHSSDGGTNWSVAETPMVHGAASQGIFSVAFKDVRHGVIAGGDYSRPEQAGANLALTDDGGRTWRLAAVQQQKYFSAIGYVAGTDAIVAVGAASALSVNDLRSWTLLLPLSLNALDSPQGLVYAVGPNGSIATYKLK
jgi:photosystem II stability/assembly factor-like uncharacterized protein